MAYLIEVKNATKQFKGKVVFEGVNLNVSEGEIVGVVGTNGSGKTILFKCILGLIPLNEGIIKVIGKRIGKDIDIPNNIGTIIESPGFLNNKSGFENLKFLAIINNKINDEIIYQTLYKVGLNPKDTRPVSTYSMGMRQRLGVAQAIMESPPILILDEPLNGLDRYGVEEMRDLLLSLKQQGHGILITSHSTEDIDILCDRVWKFSENQLVNIK